MTNPIIVAVAKGWEIQAYGQKPIGPFKSFREAQLKLRSLLSPDEFERRFPETARTFKREVTDQQHQRRVGDV